MTEAISTLKCFHLKMHVFLAVLAFGPHKATILRQQKHLFENLDEFKTQFLCLDVESKNNGFCE